MLCVSAVLAVGRCLSVCLSCSLKTLHCSLHNSSYLWIKRVKRCINLLASRTPTSPMTVRVELLRGGGRHALVGSSVHAAVPAAAAAARRGVFAGKTGSSFQLIITTTARQSVPDPVLFLRFVNYFMRPTNWPRPTLGTGNTRTRKYQFKYIHNSICVKYFYKVNRPTTLWKTTENLEIFAYWPIYQCEHQYDTVIDFIHLCFASFNSHKKYCFAAVRETV